MTPVLACGTVLFLGVACGIFYLRMMYLRWQVYMSRIEGFLGLSGLDIDYRESLSILRRTENLVGTASYVEEARKALVAETAHLNDLLGKVREERGRVVVGAPRYEREIL